MQPMPIFQSGAVAFWMGLGGIFATGFMVDIGVGDLFADAQTILPLRGSASFILLAAFVCLCDLSALGVLFAGGIVTIQRLRGRV